MSISGIKLLGATVIGLHPVTNVPAYLTDYKCASPVTVPGGGLHYGGSVVTLVDDLTESTFNLQVQQAIADEANLQTSNVEQFVVTDVLGGRI